MHENFTYRHLHVLLVEAKDIVSCSCVLCKAFKRTAVNSYGRHSGPRVKLKLFFCLCLRNNYNNYCSIIGNCPNLKISYCRVRQSLSRLPMTFCFSDVKIHEAVTFFKFRCFECNGKMATSWFSKNVAPAISSRSRTAGPCIFSNTKGTFTRPKI